MITVECPECKQEIECDVIVDNNYGADADGNRGVYQKWSEFDHECEPGVAISQKLEERINDLALEADSDDYEEYD